MIFDLCKAISGAETAAQYNEKGGEMMNDLMSKYSCFA
jgi:hypothetical protein